MAWACRYCTYSNDDNGETQCSMCGMPGKRGSASAQYPNDGGDHGSVGGGSHAPTNIDLTWNNGESSSSSKQQGSAPPLLSGSSRSTRKRKAPSGTTSAATALKPSAITSLEKSSLGAAAATKHYSHSFSYKVLPRRNPLDVEKDTDNVLKTVFQLERLRNLQPQAVKCALDFKSQMIVMATGGGK